MPDSSSNPRKRRFLLTQTKATTVTPLPASVSRLESLLYDKDNKKKNKGNKSNATVASRKKLKTGVKVAKSTLPVINSSSNSIIISNNDNNNDRTTTSKPKFPSMTSRTTNALNVTSRNSTSRNQNPTSSLSGLNGRSGKRGLKGATGKKQRFTSKLSRNPLVFDNYNNNSNNMSAESDNQDVAGNRQGSQTNTLHVVASTSTALLLQDESAAAASRSLEKDSGIISVPPPSSVKPKSAESSKHKTSRPSIGIGLGLTLSKNKVAASKRSVHQHRQSVSSAVSMTLPSTALTTANATETNVLDDLRATKSQTMSESHSNSLLASSLGTSTAATSRDLPSFCSNIANPSSKNNISLASSSNNSKRRKQENNDNFVRLNLRNNAGACRGARNKKTKKRRWQSDRSFQRNYDAEDNDNASLASDDDTNVHTTTKERRQSFRASAPKSSSTSYVSKMSGLDPLDEFMDGTFRSSSSNNSKPSGKKLYDNGDAEAPKCARHQRPCKLVTVRKNTTGNKGRKFYACSMPRGEQCNHFQWADDTVEAARKVISKNGHHSTFISRQVAEHVARFRVLTVPELREEAARRKLNKAGKKQELLMRLAVWARDEIVKASPHLDQEADQGGTKLNSAAKPSMATSEFIDLESSDTEGESDSGDDSSSVSSEEGQLEFQSECCHEESSGDSDTEPTVVPRISMTPSEPKSLVQALNSIFGHKSFRKGQEWAIQRCLDRKKSLLVAPTGFGKSLCYALPAALSDGVCIVVSPLISLIQDQLRSLPPGIPAATLSGTVSASKSAAILDDLKRKRLKVLFVSPERLTSPAFRRLFNLTWDAEKKTKQRMFPEISLLCIDEAHCISQWAHNFRPCFLRFKALLRLMQPKSVLAITATAGPKVVEDIRETLDIDAKGSVESEDDSIKIVRSGRDNIDVKVKILPSHEKRLETVVGILTPDVSKSKTNVSDDYAGELPAGSVIVYVWRQKDTEVVAEYLNAAGVSGGVVIYHGGMDASARAKSQSRFMRGKARVCVATVAFGLGIDKSDIRGVIHLYLSNSPEHYLQEIGRAGRDGRSAVAIALPLAEEVPVRHSLSHSNLITKIQVESLLQKLKASILAASEAIGLRSTDMNRNLHIALPVQESVLDCDCKQETIETFLSLIERSGGDNPLIQVEGLNYDKATIALKKRSLKKLAENEDVASAILAVSQCLDPPIGDLDEVTSTSATAQISSTSFQKNFLAYSKGSYSFSIAKCANHLGPSAEPRHIFAALRRLQSSNELELHLDTSEKGRIFHLQATELGARIFGSDKYDDHEESLTSEIFKSFSSSSCSSANKVLDMHYILHQVAAAASSRDDDDETVGGRSSSLLRFQELTNAFFAQGIQNERTALSSEILPSSFFKCRDRELVSDVHALLHDLPQIYKDQGDEEKGDSSVSFQRCTDYTALAITKFLHGVDSPRTPYLACRSHPIFGKWRHVNFELVHSAVCKNLES